MTSHRPLLPPGLRDDVLDRGRASLGGRLNRLRNRSWAVGQCAVAAGVAYFIAKDVFGHQTPFFAPIAAVVSLGTTYGQRLRRVAEVTIGVALGVFFGDLITHVLGSGAWQIALIVVMAMAIALLLDAGAIFVTQAAVQAIVVATLVAAPGDAFLRWTDALIGGGVALVAATVVPRAPLRRPRQEAAAVVRKLSELLRAAADCLSDGDVDHALAVLKDARSTDSLITELRAASDEGMSVLASSPFRRRHREHVRWMNELVEPLDFALRNTRVLVRRVAVAVYRREPVPHGYDLLIRDLAWCVDEVADELDAGRQATEAIDGLMRLGRATTQVARTHDLSGEVVLAQVRSLIADLLAICGMDPFEATDAVPLLRDDG